MDRDGSSQHPKGAREKLASAKAKMQIPLHDLSQLLTQSDAPLILDSDTASAPYSSSSPSFPFYPVGSTHATVGIPSPPTYSPSYQQQQLSRQSPQNWPPSSMTFDSHPDHIPDYSRSRNRSRRSSRTRVRSQETSPLVRRRSTLSRRSARKDANQPYYSAPVSPMHSRPGSPEASIKAINSKLAQLSTSNAVVSAVQSIMMLSATINEEDEETLGSSSSSKDDTLLSLATLPFTLVPLAGGKISRPASTTESDTNTMSVSDSEPSTRSPLLHAHTPPPRIPPEAATTEMVHVLLRSDDLQLDTPQQQRMRLRAQQQFEQAQGPTAQQASRLCEGLRLSVADRCAQPSPRPATDEELLAVHSRAHVQVYAYGDLEPPAPVLERTVSSPGVNDGEFSDSMNVAEDDDACSETMSQRSHKQPQKAHHRESLNKRLDDVDVAHDESESRRGRTRTRGASTPSNQSTGTSKVPHGHGTRGLKASQERGLDGIPVAAASGLNRRAACLGYSHQAKYVPASIQRLCHAARVSAGCAIDATLSVARGIARNAFVVCHPPGNMAMRAEAKGFCFFNNIAVAAKAALELPEISRILIVDLDIHHGCGTEEAFLQTDEVLVVNLHRYADANAFPHTGHPTTIGTGRGAGYNVNIAWLEDDASNGLGDSDYIAAFRSVVLPIGIEFAPDLVLVSAGFDACRLNAGNNGQFQLSTVVYGYLVNMLTSLTDGKVVVVTEGSTHVASAVSCATMCCRALLGETLPLLPTPATRPSKACLSTLQEVVELHASKWPSIASAFETAHFSPAEFMDEDAENIATDADRA